MKGIVVTSNNAYSVQDFDKPIYKSVGKTVGGFIEIVHPRNLAEPYCMMVNDEGLLKGLPVNPVGCVFCGTANHGYPIVGDIVFMKECMTAEGLDIIGLTDSEVTEMTMQIAKIINALETK